MPYPRPSLTEIVSETESGIQSRLPDADSALRRSVLAVLARVEGGIAHGLYGFIEWVSRQILPDTASDEMLSRHAAIRGIKRRGAAPAEGVAVLNSRPEGLIPAGRIFKRSDGARYESLADATADAAGLIHVPLRAVLPGKGGNAAAGARLNMVSPSLGVEGNGAVGQSGLTGGLDIEEVESWRARVLERWRNPPRGGSVDDWIRWTLEVEGVDRAWCHPGWMGPGTVGIIFSIAPGNGGPVPDEVTLKRVTEHLNSPSRRPPTAHVYVIPPEVRPVDLTLFELTPDTEAVRSAVRASLADLLAREAYPGCTVLVSHLREAISAAAGETDHSLGSPAANLICRPWEIPVLGEITWPERTPA